MSNPTQTRDEPPRYMESSYFRKNAWDAAWFVVFCGVASVGWDTGRLVLSGRGTPVSDLLRAQLAVTGLTVLHALLAAAVLAPLFAFAMGEASTAQRSAGVLRWLKQKLGKQDPHRALGTHASLLSSPVAAAALVGLAVSASMRTHTNVRVALNAAGALLLIHAGAVLLGVLVFLSLRGVLLALLKFVGRARWTHGWLARPGVTALVIGLGAAVGAGVGLRSGWNVLRALELTWLWGGLVVVSAGLLLAWARTLPNVDPRTRRRLTAGTAAGLVLLLALSMFVVPYTNTSRGVMVTRTTFATIWNQSQTALLDWDRDGYTAYFGGNDCAPFDSSVSPGALDIPYNGIDDDCMGGDLRYDGEGDVHRWDYPVPANVPKRPHIVLLTVDALNPDHLGFSGYERATSPNLDALSKEAAVFTAACAQGPSTRLSLPSLFTSLYDPQIKRLRALRFPMELLPENVMMAEVLRDHGYQTITVLTDGYLKNWKGITQGFQVVDSSALRGGGHTSERATDAAIRLLQEGMKKDAPIFLWLHYDDPHQPWEQPRGAPSFGNREIDLYDAEIWYTDKHMGRLLDWIEQNIEESERLIVVSADHGESFDKAHPTKHHGFDLHTSVIRVPLLFKAEWLPPRKIQQPTSLLDLLPTFVNLTRIHGSFGFEGNSLMPALLRGETPAERVTYHTFFLPEALKRGDPPLQHASVRTEQYNLIHDRINGVYALYDFVADPQEENDLFNARPELATALQTRLQLWHYRIMAGQQPAPPASGAAAPAAVVPRRAPPPL